jgi:hypothetical protein
MNICKVSKEIVRIKSKMQVEVKKLTLMINVKNILCPFGIFWSKQGFQYSEIFHHDAIIFRS